MNWPAVITSLYKQARAATHEAEIAMRDDNLIAAQSRVVVGLILTSLAEALGEGTKASE